MPAALPDLRRQRALALLVPLFLCSGATSLVYETLWERQLHLVVGTSQLAVITVLTAFMAGLAAGGFGASRLADRLQRPLLAYGVLEGAIGLYAVAFPYLIQGLVPVYTGFWQAFTPSPLAFAVFQFGLLGLFLLPPTICMGATLPVLARFAWAATPPGQAGQQVGRLYGANTLGAVLGVGAAGFLLLPGYGLKATTFITAAGNVALCALAFGLDRYAGALGAARPPAADGDAAPAPTAARPGPWLAALGPLAALAGLSSLIYEVSWFRVMVLTLGGSAYAFSIMLLSFLLGIGLGGWVGGRLADLSWRRGGVAGNLRALAGMQVGVAALAYGVMWQYNELPFVFTYLFDYLRGGVAGADPGPILWVGKLGLAMAIMVPPALLMGASFPLLVRAATVGEGLGQPVGRIYGWNTVGSIFGASVGGLVLLPELQLTQTMLVAVSLNLVAAALAVGFSGTAEASGRRGQGLAWAVPALLGIGLVHAARPPWDPLLMTAGMYKYASELHPEDVNREGILNYAVTPYELVYYREGLSSVVTVARSVESDNMWLANNGKVDASTRLDMPTQVLCAHLPFVFVPEPEQAMVIGLASGITAGSATLHARAKRFEIIELEPAIVEASHYFDEYNNRPLEDPRVTLIANDGRNHLFLQPDGKYDLIISEPSNPWLSGVSNLFTAEFFAMGKRKLKPGGVWSQWIQMYGMDHEDLRSLMRTFSEAYAHVLLFSTIDDADLVLIASDSPLDLTADKLGDLMAKEPKVAADLKLIDIEHPEDVLTRYLVNEEGIREFAAGAPLNTDDNMRIEYSAPRNLHKDTADDNFLSLLQGSGARNRVPVETVTGPHGLVDLAHAYTRRDDHLKATLALKMALEQAPEDPLIFEAFTEAQAALKRQLEEEEAEARGEGDGDE
jgi:spermidine synthase